MPIVVIRKIMVAGKEFLEVQHREHTTDKWSCEDVHSDWREAEKQKQFIKKQYDNIGKPKEISRKA